jgi:hypothetical protein
MFRTYRQEERSKESIELSFDSRLPLEQEQLRFSSRLPSQRQARPLALCHPNLQVTQPCRQISEKAGPASSVFSRLYAEVDFARARTGIC